MQKLGNPEVVEMAGLEGQSLIDIEERKIAEKVERGKRGIGRKTMRRPRNIRSQLLFETETGFAPLQREADHVNSRRVQTCTTIRSNENERDVNCVRTTLGQYRT